MALEKTKTLSWVVGENSLHAQIRSESWVHRDCGLVVRISMEGGGGALMRLDKPFRECTDDDFIELCHKVKLIKCKECGGVAFDPAVVQTNRDGLCEACFGSVLRIMIKRHVDPSDEKALLRRNMRMVKDCFTHHIATWIRPANRPGHLVDIYFSRFPTPAEVRLCLRKNGGVAFDSYQVNELKEKNDA